MSFTRVQRREEAATEETSSHNALSAAYALGYPFQVLTWGKSRFKLNMLQEVKSVAVKNVKTCAGGLYEIIQLFLLHPGCRSGPNIQSQLTWYHGSTGLSLSRTRKKGACFTSRGACAFSLFGLLSRVHARESSKRLYACGRMRAEPEKNHHQNDDQQQHQRGEFFYAHRSSNEAVLSGVVEP